MERETIFERPPLPFPKEQIRLLRFLPGADDAPLQCTLSTHFLHEVDNQYIAISYTWGTGQLLQPLDVNGQAIEVRVNCWYALWQMRHHDPGQAYWIDSICIDQSCHGEKKSQVLRMGNIYSSASRVAACLGHSDRFDIYLTAPRRCNEQQSAAAWHSPCRRPYFARVWTLQECLHSRQLELYTGKMKFSLEDLVALFDTMQGFRVDWTGPLRRLKHYTPSLALIAFMWDLLQPTSPHHSSRLYNLEDLILSYHHRNCMNPRDKVYGLLSLCEPEVQQHIQPDYERSLLGILRKYCGMHAVLELGSGPDFGEFVTADLDTLTGNLGPMLRSIRSLAHHFASCSSTFTKELADLASYRFVAPCDMARTARREHRAFVSQCDSLETQILVRLPGYLYGISTQAKEHGSPHCDTLSSHGPCVCSQGYSDDLRHGPRDQTFIETDLAPYLQALPKAQYLIQTWQPVAEASRITPFLFCVTQGHGYRTFLTCEQTNEDTKEYSIRGRAIDLQKPVELSCNATPPYAVCEFRNVGAHNENLHELTTGRMRQLAARPTTCSISISSDDLLLAAITASDTIGFLELMGSSSLRSSRLDFSPPIDDTSSLPLVKALDVRDALCGTRWSSTQTFRLPYRHVDELPISSMHILPSWTASRVNKRRFKHTRRPPWLDSNPHWEAVGAAMLSGV